MLYRCNCNTLLSSSLQNCYINGVCFDFQLAAQWKKPPQKTLCYLSLGTSVHKRKKKKGDEVNLCGLIWATSLYFTHSLEQKEKPMSGKYWRPSHLSTRSHWFVLFHVKQQSCSLPSLANQLSSINQTQSVDSYLVNRLTRKWPIWGFENQEACLDVISCS